MIKLVIQGLALATLLSDLFILHLVILCILEKLKLFQGLSQHQRRFSPHAYAFAFLVSLTATLGSLFFSEVAKFQPCILCWYQRIMMYPQSILFYLAVIRNEKVLTPYLIVLNTIGAVIATYHYLIQRLPTMNILPCQAAGEVSCTKGYTLYFGYITIPLMALTAFLLNIIFLSFAKKTK